MRRPCGNGELHRGDMGENVPLKLDMIPALSTNLFTFCKYNRSLLIFDSNIIHYYYFYYKEIMFFRLISKRKHSLTFNVRHSEVSL